MPHESTVEHEKPSKDFGPLENARRSNSMRQQSSDDKPVRTLSENCPEDHELDDMKDIWQQCFFYHTHSADKSMF